MIELLQGDCLIKLKRIPNGSVDLIVADLPYGSTACEWDIIIPFEPLWCEYKRVIKPGAAIVCFGSQPFTSFLVQSCLDWFHCEWIWKKSNGGGYLNANRQPMKRHENIIVFCESQPIYNPQFTEGKPYRIRSSSAGETTHDQSVAGWVTDSDGRRFPITVQAFSNETGYHPTQKPVPLLEYLIKTYSNEGAVVLDNCMGSGSTGLACVNTRRGFIGIEKETAHFDIARGRIRAQTRLTRRLSHPSFDPCAYCGHIRAEHKKRCLISSRGGTLCPCYEFREGKTA